MPTQTKLQIDSEDYEFIKGTHKQLNCKSLSEYIRQAVKEKIKADQKRLREIKREKAMEAISEGAYENLFDSLDGEDFENR
ncbi:MAG: crotonobetainyl-CoA--carnitine CoA-transferase [Deltaproteobacteria bacterium]|nr:crotonobetainyl-CoA--carnitine CoA-transferase [Deltaproteobacteria bacterium]